MKKKGNRSINPLVPSVPYMARLAKILILILEGIVKKNWKPTKKKKFRQ